MKSSKKRYCIVKERMQDKKAAALFTFNNSAQNTVFLTLGRGPRADGLPDQDQGPANQAALFPSTPAGLGIRLAALSGPPDV